MSRIWLLSLICLAVSLSLFVPTTNARFDLRVNEDSSTISFQQLAPTVFLTIENRNDKPVAGTIRVELLKPSNEAIGTTEMPVVLPTGKQQIRIVLPAKTRDLLQETKILWYRLHYRVTAEDSGASPIEGLISLSRITPDLFELRVSAPAAVGNGTLYQARVRAVHPVTDRPAKGVAITGSVNLSDDEDIALTDSGTTNSDGYADLQFQLPANVITDELELSVEGTRGLLTVTAEEEIDVQIRPHILISTDKPIYQPGQTLHTRALVLSATRRALAGKNVALSITDADDDEAFKAELETSRFGIANTDWKIPEHIKLGEYRLTYSMDDDELAVATISISRYELPNFVVNVKPDRTYYLAGQDANVTVRGDYLFGEPVQRGRVRVVRKAEPKWNRVAQKYDDTEQTVEGELGSDHTFVIKIPLANDLQTLHDEDRRFSDLKFTAYLTDASTNRTEQRRFTLRLSKEAIHLYAIRPGDRYRESAGLPLVVYIAASYADGTAARCNVTAAEVNNNKNARVVARVKTNQYGFAKIVQPRSSAADDSAVTLRFDAHDGNGNNGTQVETFDFESKPGLTITTPKTILARGESIPVTIITTDPIETVTLAVVREWSMLHSQTVRVSGGRASVLVPYKPDFKQEITLAAYVDGDEDDELLATRSVMYPSPRDLKLNLRADSDIYRPGEQARVSFKSATADGRTVASALGVVVVDKAVEERSRADLEPDRYYASFLDEALSLTGHSDSLGVITRNSLENLDMSKLVPPDLDLAAEIFLNRSSNYYPKFFSSEEYEKDAYRVFEGPALTQLQQLREVLTKINEQTGAYPSNESSLRQLISNSAVSLDSIRDPWGMPYRPIFFLERNAQVMTLKTFGPDKQADTADDFFIGRMGWAYFRRAGESINDAVRKFYQRTGATIRDFKTLRYEVLPSGIDLETLKDPWLKPYIFDFEASKTGVTINVKTSEGSSDQYFVVWATRFEIPQASVVNFTTLSQHSAQELPKDSRPIVVSMVPGSTGGITGTVLDPMGAAVSGAVVKALRMETNVEAATAKTDDSGRFLLRNLPPGLYELRVEASGFQLTSVTDIRVRASEIIELNVTLQVAAATETVTVSAAAEVLSLNSSSVSTSQRLKNPTAKSASSPFKPTQQFFTPRVREFFPETLVWNPQLTTDNKGRAQLNFKLADNITTWKLSVIGSTENGEIGVAETEIKTFQPFFAELDPPQILTQGDQIALPVVLRNYLNAKQTVDVQLKPETWFTVLSAPRKQTEVAARESSTETFSIQAVSSVAEGRQQVTALGSDFSDAIEKRVTVHPDGEEKTTTASRLLDQSTTLTVGLPTDTISKSARLELKVYPNLASHVWESIEGIMKRPYGCGEQTISSTYPSLLVLKKLKQQSDDGPLAQKARGYLQAGYQRLLGYQSSDGGFSYWGQGDSDVALTAYAIRFLVDADDLIAINRDVVSRARSWLAKQQRPDGGWRSRYGTVDPDRMLTAFVARSLSLIAPCKNTDENSRAERIALEKALNFLERVDAPDNAYLLASYSLASFSCDRARAITANNRLLKMTQVTQDGASWPLETTTPFYGWGRTGQIETTALVVQALAQQLGDNSADVTKLDAVIKGALLFLLREKDRYGVWYSTQATINVVDSLLMLGQTQFRAQQGATDKVDVFVNNEKVDSLELPTKQQMAAPLILDVSSAMRIGENKIELKRSGGGAVASVQAVGSYWIPWKSPQANTSSNALRLQTNCDKYEARVMEPIKCHVMAERIDLRGRGMMIAEIGLPPGADVDRAFLDAVKTSRSAIDQYDILPDRIIVYLWPSTRGVEFDFVFRPRMAINAQSAASVLYDYYNPDARATVPPSRFVVK